MRVKTGRFELWGVRSMKHEPFPWLYPREHPAHARNPYTLLRYYGGMMQRIYDWQGRPVEIP